MRDKLKESSGWRMLRKFNLLLWSTGLILGAPLLFGAIGFVFLSKMGLYWGFLIGCFLQVALGFGAEGVLIWLFKAQPFWGESALKQCVERESSRGSKQLSKGVLKIYVIPEVRPRFYWVRPLASMKHVSVFVSQGLVSQINGAELESLFQASFLKLTERSGYSRSLFRVLDLLIHQWSARDEALLCAKKNQGLYPLILLIKLWILLPIKTFLREALGMDDLEWLRSDDPNLNQARLKLKRLKMIWK